MINLKKYEKCEFEREEVKEKFDGEICEVNISQLFHLRFLIMLKVK